MKLFRALTRLRLNIIFELKGMRFYRLQLLVSLFVMPLAFVVVLLAGKNLSSDNVTFVLSGFIVTSMVGSFLGTLALRVSNMMMPDILELYATFSLSRREMVTGMSVTYGLLALPQILVAGTITAFTAPAFQPGLFIFAILIGMFSLAAISVWLGLLVRNYYQAMGLFPLLNWIVVLLSSAYYDPSNMSTAFQWILLVNPVTHYLNLLRSSLGFSPAFSPIWSLVYTFGLLILLIIAINKRVREMYILERF